MASIPKTADEFALLTDKEKVAEWQSMRDCLNAFYSLHRDDEFLRATVCGDRLVRVIFNGGRVTREHLDELIKLISTIRDGFKGEYDG